MTGPTANSLVAEDVILVGGEALYDLVVGASDEVRAHPGGGPFNTARTIGRLQQPVAFLGRLADLEPDRLELTLKLLGVFLAEVVLQRERLNLRRLDEAALFSALHECAGMLGFEQLVHLVLRQFLLRLSRCCGSLDLSHCKRNLLGRLGSTGTFNDLVTSNPV